MKANSANKRAVALLHFCVDEEMRCRLETKLIAKTLAFDAGKAA